MKIKLLYTFGAIALGLLSTNSFSQSTPFVPQVKDWGTYLPVGTIPDPGLVNPNGHRLRPVLNSRGDIIISWGAHLDGSNIDTQANWVTSEAYQPVISGIRDVFLTSINKNGTVNWATYFGGEGRDGSDGKVIDSDDNIYLIGSTNSLTGISTNDAYQQEHTNYYTPAVNVNMGGIDIEIFPEKLTYNFFITKFNSQGHLLWSTYFEGNKGAAAGGLTVVIGSSGIYFSGFSLSNLDLATAGSMQPTWPAQVPSEAPPLSLQPGASFLTKFSFDGQLLWSTYTHELGHIASIDDEDNIYLSSYYGTSNVYTNMCNCVTKIDSNGNFVESIVPPIGTEYTGIYKDQQGNYYYSGITSRSDVGTNNTLNPIRNFNFNTEAFIEKYDPNMQKLWGTYLTLEDPSLSGISFVIPTVNAAGEIWFSGTKYTDGFGTSGVFQENLSSGTNDYVAKLNTNGQLDWFTYHGGESLSNHKAIAYNDECVIISGTTQSTTGIATENGIIADAESIESYTNNNQDIRAYLLKLIPNQELSTPTFGNPQVLVYPNPAKEKLMVMSTHLFSAKTKLEIYDSLGKKISEHKGISANVNTIDVSALSQGLYFLKITEGKLLEQTIKFVKE